MALLKCIMIAMAVFAATEAAGTASKLHTYTYPSGSYPATGYYPASLSSYTYNPSEFYQGTGYNYNPSEYYQRTGYNYNPSEFYQRTGYNYNPSEFYQRPGSSNGYTPYSYQRYYDTPLASTYQAYPYYSSVYPAGVYPAGTSGAYLTGTSGVNPVGTSRVYSSGPSGVYPVGTSGVYPSQYAVPDYPAGYVPPVQPVSTVSHNQVPSGGFGYSYTTYGQPTTTNVDASKVKADTKP